jgi:hypothetical protein
MSVLRVWFSSRRISQDGRASSRSHTDQTKFHESQGFGVIIKLLAWVRASLQKLIVPQLVKPFVESRNLFISARLWSSSRQMDQAHILISSFGCILMLSSHVCVGTPSGLCPSYFVIWYLSSRACNIICPSHPFVLITIVNEEKHRS